MRVEVEGSGLGALGLRGFMALDPPSREANAPQPKAYTAHTAVKCLIGLIVII